MQSRSYSSKGMFRTPAAGDSIFRGHVLSKCGRYCTKAVPIPFSLSSTFPSQTFYYPYRMSPSLSLTELSSRIQGNTLLRTIPVKQALAIIYCPKQHPLLKEKPLKMSELNMNGSLLPMTWLELMPDILLFLSQSSMVAFSIFPSYWKESLPQIMRIPRLDPLGSQQTMLAYSGSLSSLLFSALAFVSVFRRVPASFLSFSLPSAYFGMVKIDFVNPAQSSGRFQWNLKLETPTFFFQVYRFKCSVSLFTQSEATSIHSQLSLSLCPYAASSTGLMMMASVMVLPLGFKNIVQRATLGYCVGSLLYSKDTLLVVTPWSSFWVSGPQTTTRLRLSSLANEGFMNSSRKLLGI